TDRRGDIALRGKSETDGKAAIAAAAADPLREDAVGPSAHRVHPAVRRRDDVDGFARSAAATSRPRAAGVGVGHEGRTGGNAASASTATDNRAARAAFGRKRRTGGKAAIAAAAADALREDRIGPGTDRVNRAVGRRDDDKASVRTHAAGCRPIAADGGI